MRNHSPQLNKKQKMLDVKGTIGYSKVVQKYVEVTEEIPFERLHKEFLAFIPTEPSLIFDIGAGTGRDAYELSLKGHTVFAVEPLNEFRIAGNEIYQTETLKWIDDAAPELNKLTEYEGQVDFVLSSSVWHHLTEIEQEEATKKVARLLKPNGIFALLLRNGPAGAGTHVFPTSLQKTIDHAKKHQLETLFQIDNQASLMKNKEKVKWARLVLQKKSN